ncbi:MAG: hypothetical protein U9Q94_00830 [Candidatus Bipolaricaulota bacterium]|nr:hypothetical protein [Candidatus Bipolaricaulota bacterium]
MGKEIVLYLLRRLKEAHPFTLSRLLLLLDLEQLKAHGWRVTQFRYVFMLFGFNIGGFPLFLESLAGVEKLVAKDEERRPIREFSRITQEGNPELCRDIVRVVEEAGQLDDQELNKLAVECDEYQEPLNGLLSGWG